MLIDKFRYKKNKAAFAQTLIRILKKIDKIKVMITAIKPTISCSESGKTLRIKNDAKWEYFRAIKMLINIEQKLNIVIIKPFLYPL